MNTLYQKSTKINIFHAHTFYIYVYMYIFYMQTLLIQSTATTRLVLDAENWSVQFKFGNSLWGFLEIWCMHLRDSREAVKIEEKGLYEQPWSGLTVTVSVWSNAYEAGGGLDNWSFFVVFCIRTEVIPRHRWAVRFQGGISEGLWGLRSKTMGKGARPRGEKAKLLGTERHLFCFPVWVQCLHALSERLRFPSPSLEWNSNVSFKISNKVFVPSYKENV